MLVTLSFRGQPQSSPGVMNTDWRPQYHQHRHRSDAPATRGPPFFSSFSGTFACPKTIVSRL